MDQALLNKWKQKQIFHRKISIEKEGHLLAPDQFVIEQLKNEMNQLVKNGIQFTYWGHSDYPHLFYKMKNPPYFLTYIGKPVWNQMSCLSVVGSRDYHELSRKWIQTELNNFLEKEDVCTVSGGAIGIDQLVHLISLKNNKPTIVVLPSGLQSMYPKQIEELSEQIIKCGGAIVSEFDLQAPLRKNFFFFRNRLIAAFSKMCLVVECKIKSGTYLTVHHALENGRVVATIPSHPVLSCYSGNHLLLQDGAICITSAHELSQNFAAECWSSLEI